MTKLKYDDKVKIYLERKNGKTINYICNKYKIGTDHIKYLIRLIDKHGYEILLKEKNIEYPINFKQEVVDRVILDNESIREVAIDVGMLSHAVITRWVKNYKENGYNIVETKRKRGPTMPKNCKIKIEETTEEKVKRLEIENEYLKAEIEYSKKLKAVVQARKKQQQEKK